MSFHEEAMEQLRSELDVLHQRLHESLERESAAVESVETAKCEVENLKEEVKRLETQALDRSMVEQEYVQAKLELEVARAVEQERYKWQKIEAKLLNEIADVKKQLSESNNTDIARSVCANQGIGLVNSVMNVSTTDEGVIGSTPGTIPSTCQYNVVNANSTISVADGVAASSLPHMRVAYPFHNNMYSPEIMMSLSPLGKFSGESELESGEQFTDWIEQFELVASAYHWDNHTKLVNLTTRLKGQAFAFYRSCSTLQWGDYDTFVRETKKHFTPVHLQAVQSSLFHDRRQRANESVDVYAQELRTLFFHAYSQAQQGAPETENMACMMLANQFAAGLKQEIKVKVAGVEGSFEKLLQIARFEEAKLRDLGYSSSMTKGPANYSKKQDQKTNERHNQPHNSDQRHCYTCNAIGHLSRHCPQRGRGAPMESQGRRTTTTSNAGSVPRKLLVIVPEQATEEEQKTATEPDLEEVLEEAAATINVLNPPGENGKDHGGSTLGPTLTAEVMVEDQPVTALLDTGSPVTILSLNLIMNRWAQLKKEGQTNKLVAQRPV